MCHFKKRKTSNSNPIIVENILTITPSHFNSVKNEKIRDLESVFNDIISQLNAHFDYKVKTSDETLTNIYALVLDISKKYNIENNV